MALEDNNDRRDTATRKHSPRTILRPLAVALVCLVFIVLFLVMAMMNLRALDNTLTQFTNNKGLAIIKNIQQSAESYLQLLERTQQAFWGLDLDTTLGTDTLSLQESFLLDVMELAQAMDEQQVSNRLNQDQLLALTEKEHLGLVGFLDDNGHIDLNNRPVPPEVLHWADPVVKGHRRFKIDVLKPSADSKERLLVALQRQSGHGTIIVALADKDLGYRKVAYAVQRVLGEMTADADVAYVNVQDVDGRVLRLAGQLPEHLKKPDRREYLTSTTSNIKTRKLVSGGQKLQEILTPFYMLGELAGDIRVGLATAVTDSVLKDNRRNILISTTFMVLVTCLAMWVLYKSQNRYLAKVRQMERRVYQIEKLSALGRLAAGVAHEIRNPLNAISMATQRLQRDTDHELTGVIRDETRRLNQIIEDFLGISRSRELRFRPYDIRVLIEQITRLYDEEMDAAGIDIQTQWPDTPCVIAMDVDKMKQALLNIIKNAVESITGPGTLKVTVTSDGQNWVNVQISDTGAGLSHDQMSYIFDLDYTTKEKGLGFGLPLAHEIVRGHGGEIRVNSKSGKGTTFNIQLPIDHPQVVER